nr:aromatic-ring-hydroxylating dioxygenase subunit beta [Sphingomonas sp. Y57]
MGGERSENGAFEIVELFAKDGSGASREPARPAAQSEALPARAVDHRRQHQVEQFLYGQSELLDTRSWGAYIDLFADDGLYWMPVSADQQDWLDTPSICLEDKSLMGVRMDRMLHPNAWSLSGLWETSHIVGNVVIDADDGNEIKVRSRFHMFEQRRDASRHFAGRYQHVLIERDGRLRIQMQRVDLVNSRAPFDYVIQAWI